jgi:hypothetical protein
MINKDENGKLLFDRESGIFELDKEQVGFLGSHPDGDGVYIGFQNIDEADFIKKLSEMSDASFAYERAYYDELRNKSKSFNCHVNKDEWLRVDSEDHGGMKYLILKDSIDRCCYNEATESISVRTKYKGTFSWWTVEKGTPDYQTIYDMFFGEEGGVNRTTGNKLLNSLDNAITKKIKEVKQQDELDMLDRFNRYIDNIVGSKLCGGDRQRQEAFVKELKEVADDFKVAPPTINKSTSKK